MDLHLYSTWTSLCYPSPRFLLDFGCPFDSSEQEFLQEPSFSFLPLKSKREQITGLLTRRAARSIEGEHSLNGDVHGGDVEGFKHDLKEQCRTEDYQKSLLSWPTEWLVILLRGGPVRVYSVPTSRGLWRGLHSQQVLKKLFCIDAWLGKRIWSSVHVCSCVGTQVSLASYLGHLLPVGLGIQRGLREQGGVFLGGDPQLIVEGVVPDLVGRKVR